MSILIAAALALTQPPDPDVVRWPPHPRGADLEHQISATCPDGPVRFSCNTGAPGLTVTRPGGSHTYGPDDRLVRDAFAARTQLRQFWIRCEADGVVTLGYRLARQGAETPEFIAGVAEYGAEGNLLSYTGAEPEQAARLNRQLHVSGGAE